MNDPVTVGMIAWPVIIFIGACGILGLCLFLIWLFNPFRSGH